MKRIGMMLVAIAMCTGPSLLAAESASRTITVSGRGTVRVAPDYAQMTFAAEVTTNEVSAAKAQVDAILTKLVAVFNALQINAKDFNTTRLFVHPKNDYTQGELKYVGYEVSRNAEVTLRDLNKLESLLERSVEAGVTAVYSVELCDSAEASHRQEAMEQACADAKSKATLLAKQFGASVGAIEQISYSDTGHAGILEARAWEPRVGSAAGAPGSAGGESSYRPGEIQIGSEVTATFDLIPDTEAEAGRRD